MSDDMKYVGFNAPRESVEKVKSDLEHGGLSRILRERLEEAAYGVEVAERTRVKENLRDLREERRGIESKISKLQNDREEKDREIERLEQKLDRLAEQDGEYDGHLQSIEANLHDGKSVFTGHPLVKSAADAGDCDETDVIQDLQERNPELPESQFVKSDMTRVE